MSTGEHGRFGPLEDGDPNVGRVCPGCREALQVGDRPALVVIGPGADPEERQRARDGRAYNAVAIVAHEECVYG